MDLKELRKIAEAATPGPWKAEPYLYGSTGEGCRIRVTAPSSDDLHNLADDVLQEDAEFIATFDPPTVLALLSRLEQAEAIVNQLTPTHLKMIRRALDGDTRG